MQRFVITSSCLKSAEGASDIGIPAQFYTAIFYKLYAQHTTNTRERTLLRLTISLFYQINVTGQAQGRQWCKKDAKMSGG